MKETGPLCTRFGLICMISFTKQLLHTFPVSAKEHFKNGRLKDDVYLEEWCLLGCYAVWLL
jgi:hypothetical protein